MHRFKGHSVKSGLGDFHKDCKLWEHHAKHNIFGTKIRSH